MKNKRALLPFLASLTLLIASARLRAQQAVVQVPASTPLPVQLTRHVPMKNGAPLEGYLPYSVYVENRIAIPAGSVLRGRVVKLTPDKSRRIHSMLRGDFTPFHIPVVQFDQLLLPDKRVQPIASQNATDGAPVLHLCAAVPGRRRPFLAQQIDRLKQQGKDTVALFAAPGRSDRFVQYIYRQLPYHPERIESGTAWTVTLAQPLSLARNASVGDLTSGKDSLSRQVGVPKLHDRTWQLHAYLEETISSAKEKAGDTFEAVVAEPILDTGHSLVIPQGSQLVGTVTRAKRARWFGRSGQLRFKFSELKLPNGFSQRVDGTLAGADMAKSSDLQIDSEGGVQSTPKSRAIVPLALTFLAGRALDDDGSLAGNSAVASNGFGIVGRVVGIAASSRNLAAGIGFYGAALAFDERCVARGQDVVFSKNTRIEVTALPSRSLFHTAEVQQSPSIK